MVGCHSVRRGSLTDDRGVSPVASTGQPAKILVGSAIYPRTRLLSASTRARLEQPSNAPIMYAQLPLLTDCSVGELQLHDIRATTKGVVADGLQRGGEMQVHNACATRAGGVADDLERGLEMQVNDPRATFEGVVADGQERGWEAQVHDLRATWNAALPMGFFVF